MSAAKIEKVHTAEVPFSANWGELDARLLKPELAAAPTLDLTEILPERIARWVTNAAKAKGTGPDYVLAGMLAVASTLIGNARWAAPWDGWFEPPILWFALIGQPSAGKSPAMDAVLAPLRKVERPLREAAEAERKEWDERAQLAKIAEQAWKEAAKVAVSKDEVPPLKPSDCDVGPPPHIPRLAVNDATIERLGVIVARQPRGILQVRDELAGWFQGMQRYAGGGTDRPFWLECYGGRTYTIERMGRDPLTVDRLLVGVLGGIQPDRLKSLLFKADDDGLLARFIPIWPDPPPIGRPEVGADPGMMENMMIRLLSLGMADGDGARPRPVMIPFTDSAGELMMEFRWSIRDHENEAHGLMLSFLGKLPGLAARLALVLAHLEWACDEGAPPEVIGPRHFGRAAHLIESYILPMARRAYGDAATPKSERAARRLVRLIRAKGWTKFTAREVMRLDRDGLGSAAEVNAALSVLEDGDCVRAIPPPATPQGGRPTRLYVVNPAIHRSET